MKTAPIGALASVLIIAHYPDDSLPETFPYDRALSQMLLVLYFVASVCATFVAVVASMFGHPQVSMVQL